MSEHTPTPWAVDQNGVVHEPFFGGDWIAQVVERNRAANAEFIVRACNSHEDLVEALKEAHLQLVYLDDKFATGTTPAVLARIHGALVKADQP